MVNLLGEPEHQGEAEYLGMNKILGVSGVYPHLYGKSDTKPYRKMGHVTVVNADIDIAKGVAKEVKDIIKIVSRAE